MSRVIYHNYYSVQYKFYCFSLQNSSVPASEVAELVAEVTSVPENLTAADVSVSVSLVSRLTVEAITDSEVYRTVG